MRHYIYIHKNPTSFEVFYVGQGSLQRGYPDRAFSKRSRSYWWNNYVKKYGLPIVEIILYCIDKEEINKMESFYIKKYGRRDLSEGSLVNLTDGGDGTGPWSIEARKMQSDRMSGSNHPMYGKKHTLEWIKNNSISHMGKKATDETRKKMAVSKIGSKRSEETKKRMSEAHSGENNAMYGRTGTTNPASKLDWDKVSEIRKLYKEGGTSIRKLANLFDVSNPTIENIIKHRTWKILENDSK